MSENWDLFDFLYGVPDSSHSTPEGKNSMSPNGEENKEEAGDQSSKDEDGEDPFPGREFGRVMFTLMDIG